MTIKVNLGNVVSSYISYIKYLYAIFRGLDSLPSKTPNFASDILLGIFDMQEETTSMSHFIKGRRQ